jgi:hypothetical protein
MKRVFNRHLAPSARQEKLEHRAWAVHLVDFVVVTIFLRRALIAPVDFTKVPKIRHLVLHAHPANINWVLGQRTAKCAMSVHLAMFRSC